MYLHFRDHLSYVYLSSASRSSLMHNHVQMQQYGEWAWATEAEVITTFNAKLDARWKDYKNSHAGVSTKFILLYVECS
jgi:hypothetical protein